MEILTFCYLGYVGFDYSTKPLPTRGLALHKNGEFILVADGFFITMQLYLS
jgi:hypothetical protein